MKGYVKILVTILAMAILYALLVSILNPRAPDYYREILPHSHARPSDSVRPKGAGHQGRKDPPRELSVDPGS